jgi:hypothetical protein
MIMEEQLQIVLGIYKMKEIDIEKKERNLLN